MIHAIVGAGVTFIVLGIVAEVLILRAHRNFRRVMGEFLKNSERIQEELLNEAKKEIDQNGMQMQRENSREFDGAVH